MRGGESTYAISLPRALAALRQQGRLPRLLHHRLGCGWQPSVVVLLAPERDSDPDLGIGPEVGIDPEMGIDPGRSIDPEMGIGPEVGIDPAMGIDPERSIDPEMGTGLEMGIGLEENTQGVGVGGSSRQCAH